MSNFFRRLRKFLKVAFVCICFVVFAVLCLLLGSYPATSGKKKLASLENPVRIDRDDHGIPTIYAKNRLDVTRAIGFLHAQERFFQMDLLRRMSSGELSELIGPATLEMDKKNRLHSFRKHAHLLLQNLSEYEQKLLTAYTEGVNAGLNALHVRPFEYLLLRETPKPWTEEDSILVGLDLFFDLQDSQAQMNRLHQIMKRCLPEEVTQFLAYNGSVWEAPLDNHHSPILPVPSQKSFSHAFRGSIGPSDIEYKPQGCPGSNQWAVAPSCTHEGRAIVACDMHLTLSVPCIWYRLSYEYPAPDDSKIRLDGISLPGVPLLIVGSNRHIAWGFTNGCIETSRLVPIEVDPQDSAYYLTAQGRLPFEVKTEEIKVKGQPSIIQNVRWTKWGPIHPDLLFGKPAAICWPGNDLVCLNLRIFELEPVTTTQEALQKLPDIHMPVLNFMVADEQGHIGWGLVGGIPKEVAEGKDNFITTDWVHENTPPLLDPADGRLWTANNRVIANPMLGNAYHNPARAFQIKKRLYSSNQHTLATMYAIQLDEEASFYDRWEKVLEKSLDKSNLKHKKILATLHEWDHHCSSSSKGFFWIRTFREMVIKSICTRLFSPCLNASPQFHLGRMDLDEPIYLIVTQQPSYLVDPSYKSWTAELRAVIDAMIREKPERLDGDGTWGPCNVSAVQHPLSKALPILGLFLDMPKMPNGGDLDFAPKVSGRAFGASMRMVVSPGHEEDGIMNMPCGQSGHPLSPHYRDQHKAWLDGIPTSFLPGETKYTLELIP